MYMLLGACQGIVGHWKQDFDTGTHISNFFLYVTIVPFYLSTLYPIELFVIKAQAIQERKQRFVIWVGFHPQHALGSQVERKSSSVFAARLMAGSGVRSNKASFSLKALTFCQYWYSTPS
jgi:hypothetical protein